MGWIFKHYQNLEAHEINKSIYSVGRDKEADLICRNILVSKNHSTITQESEGRIAVQDLESSNGTYINEERIKPKEKIFLSDGDVLSFGISKPSDVINNKGQPHYIFHVCQVPDVIEILTSDEEFESSPPKKLKQVNNCSDGENSGIGKSHSTSNKSSLEARNDIVQPLLSSNSILADNSRPKKPADGIKEAKAAESSKVEKPVEGTNEDEAVESLNFKKPTNGIVKNKTEEDLRIEKPKYRFRSYKTGESSKSEEPNKDGAEESSRFKKLEEGIGKDGAEESSRSKKLEEGIGKDETEESSRSKKLGKRICKDWTEESSGPKKLGGRISKDGTEESLISKNLEVKIVKDGTERSSRSKKLEERINDDETEESSRFKKQVVTTSKDGTEKSSSSKTHASKIGKEKTEESSKSKKLPDAKSTERNSSHFLRKKSIESKDETEPKTNREKKSLECVKANIKCGKTKELKVVLPKIQLPRRKSKETANPKNKNKDPFDTDDEEENNLLSNKLSDDKTNKPASKKGVGSKAKRSVKKDEHEENNSEREGACTRSRNKTSAKKSSNSRSSKGVEDRKSKKSGQLKNEENTKLTNAKSCNELTDREKHDENAKSCNELIDREKDDENVKFKNVRNCNELIGGEKCSTRNLKHVLNDKIIAILGGEKSKNSNQLLDDEANSSKENKECDNSRQKINDREKSKIVNLKICNELIQTGSIKSNKESSSTNNNKQLINSEDGNLENSKQLINSKYTNFGNGKQLINSTAENSGNIKQLKDAVNSNIINEGITGDTKSTIALKEVDALLKNAFSNHYEMEWEAVINNNKPLNRVDVRNKDADNIETNDLLNKNAGITVIENRMIFPGDEPTCSKYLDQNNGMQRNAPSSLRLKDAEVDMEIDRMDMNQCLEDPSVRRKEDLVGKIHIATNLFSEPKEAENNTPQPNNSIKTEPNLDYSIGDNIVVLEDDDDQDELMMSQLYIKPEIVVEEIVEGEPEQTTPQNNYDQEVICINDDEDELLTSVCSQMYSNEEPAPKENETARPRISDKEFMDIKTELALMDELDVPPENRPIVVCDLTSDFQIDEMLNWTTDNVTVEKSPPVEEPSLAKPNEYIAPPIIPPHNIVPTKRKRLEPVAGSSSSEKNKKPKTTALRKSPRTKNKMVKILPKMVSVKQNKDIHEARRQKLKEIAMKTAKPDPIRSPEHTRITTAKHTKTSTGRGQFLLQPEHKTTHRIEPTSRPVSNSSSSRRFVDEYWDVVQSILSWNQKWIIEQKDKHVLPPIAGREVIKMCDSFASYKDYYSVLQPLIMAELWFNFCREYESSSMNKQNNQNGNLIAKIENVKVHSLYTEIIFTSYLDKKTSNSGDHIQLKNITLLSANFGSETKTCKTFFGVVVWSQKDPLKLNGNVDKKLMKMCKSTPTTKLTFMLAVKKFTEPISTTHVNMRYFTFLRQYLHLVHAVKQLATSPLLKHITDPQIGHFNIKHQRRKPNVGEKLNQSQCEALNDILYLFEGHKPGLYLLEGPPGTGKSAVIISVILEWLINLGMKNRCILLLAPSNGAIDSIINKIMFVLKPNLKEDDRQKIKLVRVGNPSAIDTKVKKYSVEDLAKAAVHTNFMREHPQTHKDYKYLEHQIYELHKRVTQNPNDKELLKEFEKKTEERTNFAENYLKSKYKSKLEEQKLVMLSGANVICSTLMSSPKIFVRGLDPSFIKMCIIDEASQCSEAETLMPIGLGINKIVMVGDPQQLPAISSSVLVKNYGYCRSLFSRIKMNLTRQTAHPIRMLNVQYRMHPEICQFPNNEYYGGRIKTVLLNRKPLNKLKPYLVFSQSNMNTAEYENRKEIDLLITLIKAISTILPREVSISIGIITPYGMQRSRINEELNRQSLSNNLMVTCNTVDSFQGQEKDVILLSCVRNTPNSFVSDVQRLNVSLTRAKYALYVIATETLLKSCPVLRKINADAKKRNLVRDLQASTSQSTFIDLISN